MEDPLPDANDATIVGDAGELDPED